MKTVYFKKTAFIAYISMSTKDFKVINYCFRLKQGFTTGGPRWFCRESANYCSQKLILQKK